MPFPVFSQESLDELASLPPAQRGPGYRTVPVNSSLGRPSGKTIEVPEDVDSLQFLLFAGFNDEVANRLWGAWERDNSNPDVPPPFHTVISDDARWYINEMSFVHDAGHEDDDWDAALTGLGLAEDLRRGGGGSC